MFHPSQPLLAFGWKLVLWVQLFATQIVICPTTIFPTHGCHVVQDELQDGLLRPKILDVMWKKTLLQQWIEINLYIYIHVINNYIFIYIYASKNQLTKNISFKKCFFTNGPWVHLRTSISMLHCVCPQIGIDELPFDSTFAQRTCGLSDPWCAMFAP